jgi:hypothetical protein
MALWSVVAIVALLVLYPLSYGPVAWLCDRPNCPAWFLDVAAALYYPIFQVLPVTPGAVQSTWANYLDIFISYSGTNINISESLRRSKFR